MRSVRYLSMVLAVALGIAVESAAFDWDDPRLWIPDLAVGLAFLIGAIVVRTRSPRPGLAALLGATGLAWFAGSLFSVALNIHRGPLFHLFLAYPSARPRTRRDAIAVAGGYVAALVPAIWRDDRTNIAVTVVLVAAVWYGHERSIGRLRLETAVVLRAAVGYALAVVTGAVARMSLGADGASVALLVYEVALSAIAIGLVLRVPDRTDPAVADLVVELGETGSGQLRDRLASALGDPSLQLGLWLSDSKGYVADDERPLALPRPGSGRTLTVIDREGTKFAALIHDATVLTDPALVDSVSAATQLASSNLALRQQVGMHLAEIAASRRRLLLAADDERRRLGLRLRRGPEQRLADLAQRLEEFDSLASLDPVHQLLKRARQDLSELGHGLHPRELTEAGLAGALDSLTDRASVPTAVNVSVGRLPREIEATVYFFCAEAIANVAKHASAHHVSVEIATADEQVGVVISDDGVGGADPARGSGLQGLSDRVSALGGRMRITSPPYGGTSITAEIPFGE